MARSSTLGASLRWNTTCHEDAAAFGTCQNRKTCHFGRFPRSHRKPTQKCVEANEQRSTRSDGRALWESAAQIASCPRWNEPQGGACFLQATGAGSPLAAARCHRSATLNAAARCTLSPCAIAQQCRRAAQIARRRKAAAGHVCGCKGVRCPPATAPQPQHGSERAPLLHRQNSTAQHDGGRNLRIFSQLW